MILRTFTNTRMLYSVVILSLAIPSVGQQDRYTQIAGMMDVGVVYPAAKPSVVHQDALSVAEIRVFQALMGATHWDDLRASGIITFGSNDPNEHAASLLVRNQAECRLDAQTPQGIRSLRIMPTYAALQSPDGNTTLLDSRATVSGLVGFPLFTNTALFDPSVGFEDGGLVVVDGVSLHRVSIQRPWPGNLKNASGQVRMSVVDFYFDPQSHELKKVASASVGPGGVVGQLVQVVSLDDYRVVNGTTLPFHYRATLNGQLLWSLQLTNVTLHVGLSDSDFHF